MSEEQNNGDKKSKHLVTIALGQTDADEVQRIKDFCKKEGLYLGRFLIRLAIRHIEEVEHERIQKRLASLK